MLFRRNLGPYFSEGARLLWGVMRRKDFDQAELARRLGKDRATVSRWIYGDRRPRIDAMIEIQRKFGVAADTWGRKPTQEFQPPALAA